MIWLASAGLALIIAAFLLRWWAQGTAAALELSGEVLHSDGDSTADVLVSETRRLVSKPDYILERDGELVPIKRQSRKLPTADAYEGEILQLAAYCLLVEEHYGRPVLSRRLLYQDRSLDVPVDDRRRAKLHNALRAVHEPDGFEKVPRCHTSSGRCRARGFPDASRKSLAKSV
jgi:CRISPR-associated exonuclease Cas4